MDRIGSSILQTAQSIRDRLKTMQYPIGELEKFEVMVDLVNMEEITFKGEYGEIMKKRAIEVNTQRHNMA